MRLGKGESASFWIENEGRLSLAISISPDPDLAVATLARLDESVGLADRLEDPGNLCDLLKILGASPFLGDQIAVHPDRLAWLFSEKEVLRSSEEAVSSIAFPEPDPASERDILLTELNSIKRREVLRIGARAVLGYSSMGEEFGALSDLADTLLDQVLSHIWPEELHQPTVMALGKLGGRELNFSSDIDLIFILPLTDSPDLTSILPSATQATEQVVDGLTRYTPEGSLYRVDLRLRPGGDRAPLIRTLRWMESYYSAQGAPWERQMMVKARICAGDRRGGELLLDILLPFIYPTHADHDPGEAAHRLRRERRAREGTALADDHVKLAPGAIRDVEFIVQVLQLLYGGRHPEIRQPSTLAAIETLNRSGLLPDSEASGLQDAYLFMRRLEHYLQMQEDRQTFVLPESSSRRTAVARLMGFGDTGGFAAAYKNHRDFVLNALNTLLPGIGEEPTGEPVESLLNLPPGGQEAARRLFERGFALPEQSHRVLLATGSSIRAGGRNAWAAFVGLLPLLLEDAVATGAPDRAVNNLERILRRLGSPGAYASLLAREASLRKALLALCASGGLLTDLLLRHPEHFERLFSTGAAGSAANRTEMRSRLRRIRRLSGSSRDMAGDLESVRTREFLAYGLDYVMGELRLEDMMMNLGYLARDLIRCFLGVHFREFLIPPQVGVFSLGTLSSGYMTFSSDADLLFIHAEGSGAAVQTLAARVAGLLSPPGGPYPVDMRLRPEGRSAPTSVDNRYMRSYLAERASPWEALALSRARPLYGRKSILDGAERTIEEWIERFRLDSETRKYLRGVRERQQEEVLKESGKCSEEDFFDLKRSAGGLSDIEYLVLGLTLDRWHRSQPRPAHIPDLIPALVTDGILTSDEGRLLTDMYVNLRRIQIGLQLHYGRDVTRLPASWPEGSAPVSLGGVTARTIGDGAAGVREIFNREFY